MSERKWIVKLSDGQMDCVIESLSWLISRHNARIKRDGIVSLDEFAHQQAMGRIQDALLVFTEIGHRDAPAS